MRMASVEEQDVACVLEYTYVLYWRCGGGEMEQMRARNHTEILFAIESGDMSDLELVGDILLLMVGTWSASSRPTYFVGFYHPIPPPIQH